ncbi:hypothetical protein [Metabacillus fastidiosus]|uniref:hypothetical protein n=1 Tax=Metabacillus fastidiosus TaxID=1458 RepID=UPI002E1E03C9|nr:hypothetical protein [Metabacillus fastidiosus]
MQYMKYSKSLLLMMMILPWFTVPLLGKNTFKRFSPAGLFISFIVAIVHFIAKKRKWWWWYETLHPKVSWGFPLILGPYFIGTLWILKWTYGSFVKYMTLNLIVNSMFTYILVDLLKKTGIASLVRLKKIQLLFIFIVDALLLYSFQFLKEKIQLQRKQNPTNEI